MSTDRESLEGMRVTLVGRLAGMPKREAQQLLRSRGATVVDKLDATVGLIVVGEGELPLDEWSESLDSQVREAVEHGRMSVVRETQLWQRLGFVEGEQNIHRLYTPAMLADLLGVPVAVIRRWHRRGLIVPARQVRRLPYFDFQEVATARRLAELLATGMSPRTIEKKLADLERLLPDVQRPLAQLSVIVEGKSLLLRQGDGLIEPGGQYHFDFESGPTEETAEAPTEPTLSIVPGIAPAAMPNTPEDLCEMAARLEEEGRLEVAVEMYRASLAAGGPQAEVCFLLAELLYRLGDLAAARERYYMAIELDENYVEARANLGCVLAETGQLDLAVAAFQGALAYHCEYPDVHYHLARALDDLGRRGEAEKHWRSFLELSPDSPWADTARERVGDG